jgi:hypothetical protein
MAIRNGQRAGRRQHLFPAWTAAKADVEKLTALHDLSIELQVQGVTPDVSAAQMQLLTAKLSAKELAELKKKLIRPGFTEEWNHLDAQAAEFAKVLLAKENAAPSATYTLFTTYAAEAVLWLGFTSKQAAVREKYENFLKVWPQAKQKVPYALMLELRITPELPGYADLVKTIFLQLIDGGLTTNEEIHALLEPHSPPAPPPPVTIKRTRAKKGADAKAKARLDDDDEDSDDIADEDEEDDDLDSLDLGGDDLDLSIGLDDVRTALPVIEGEEDDVFARDSVGDDELDTDLDDAGDDSSGDGDDDEPPPRGGKGGGRKAASRKAGRSASRQDASTAIGAGLKALALKLDLEEPSDPADLDEADPVIDLDDDEEPRPARTAGRSSAKVAPVKAAPIKHAPIKHVPLKHAPVKAVPAKAVPIPHAVPAKTPAKAPVKAPAKQVALPSKGKTATKVAAKPVKAAPAAKAKAAPPKPAVRAKAAPPAKAVGHAKPVVHAKAAAPAKAKGKPAKSAKKR